MVFLDRKPCWFPFFVVIPGVSRHNYDYQFIIVDPLNTGSQVSAHLGRMKGCGCYRRCAELCIHSSKNTDNVCLAFAFLLLITDPKPQKINLNAYMPG